MTGRDGAQSTTGVLGTLRNGMRVVETVAGRRLTLRQIAAALDLPRQTTYRLVHTLSELGWIERDVRDDSYGLTARLGTLAMRSFDDTELRDTYAPALRSLSHQYGETTHLSIYDQGDAVYIDKVDGWQPIRAYTALGGRAPAYCVATGKVLLADQSEKERQRVLGGELTRFTKLTLVNPDELGRELSTIRTQGFAVNRGEWRKEVAGLAIPIRSLRGDVVAALGFSGPAERILGRKDTLLEALNEEVGQERSWRRDHVREEVDQQI